jgi:hypothetical protein
MSHVNEIDLRVQHGVEYRHDVVTREREYAAATWAFEQLGNDVCPASGLVPFPVMGSAATPLCQHGALFRKLRTVTAKRILIRKCGHGVYPDSKILREIFMVFLFAPLVGFRQSSNTV